MRNNISIIELEPNHFDYCISLFNYVKKNNADSNIKIYITQQGYENIKSEISKINSELKLDQIYTYKSKNSLVIFFELLLHAKGHIYWNTPFYSKDMYLQALFIVLRRNLSLTVHNLNSNFQDINLGFFKDKLKRFINCKVDKFIVLNSTLKENLLQRVDKPVHVVKFKEKLKDVFNNKSGSSLSIVIPGTVNDKRRNYVDLIEMLKKIIDIHNNVSFVFLGKVVSNNIIEILNLLPIEYKEKFTWFDYYISQNHYYEYIVKSDFILAPINRQITQYGLVEEYYGETKASGAEFDAYKYGKKLFIPEFYQIKDIDIDVVYYSDENIDLYNKILSNIEDIKRDL
ncbi:MAG: hypothetical protein OCD02_01265 [Spirochaetaceae bacterium]